MPDVTGNQKAPEKELPDSPLHAHREGRDEDVQAQPFPEAQERVGDDDPGPPRDPAKARGDASPDETPGLGSGTGGIEGGRPTEP